MPVAVGLIADEIFPTKSMLPSRILVPLSATRVRPFRSIESRLAALRAHPLDDMRAVGEILISGRQCPEGMHVVRQQHPSALDSLSYAVWIVTAEGALRHLNTRAESILQASDGLATIQGRLRALNGAHAHLARMKGRRSTQWRKPRRSIHRKTDRQTPTPGLCCGAARKVRICIRMPSATRARVGERRYATGCGAPALCPALWAHPRRGPARRRPAGGQDPRRTCNGGRGFHRYDADADACGTREDGHAAAAGARVLARPPTSPARLLRPPSFGTRLRDPHTNPCNPRPGDGH
jgi:hypothetical protein